MEDREFLMIPGPVSVDDEILEALALPVRAHYGDDWTRLYKHAVSSMREVFKTTGDVHLVFGSGMAGVEMCIASVLSPGDEVLIPSNGLFGDRMVEVATANRLQVHSFRPGLAEAITAAQVRAALGEHPGVRAVCVVHHETSVGILTEVEGICRAARDHGALDDGRPKPAGWYLNLATWRRYTELSGDRHQHPTTMPTNVIEAFDLALIRLLEEGVENRWRRLAAARDRVRDGLEEMGFEMLAPISVASPVTTAAFGLPGMDVSDYLEWLLKNHRIHIGGGLGELRGRIFRVGHMGRAAEPEAIDRYLRATADYVENAGLAGAGR